MRWHGRHDNCCCFFMEIVLQLHYNVIDDTIAQFYYLAIKYIFIICQRKLHCCGLYYNINVQPQCVTRFLTNHYQTNIPRLCFMHFWCSKLSPVVAAKSQYVIRQYGADPGAELAPYVVGVNCVTQLIPTGQRQGVIGDQNRVCSLLWRKSMLKQPGCLCLD